MNQNLLCEIRHDACSKVSQWCRQLWGTGARAPSTFNMFTSLRSKSDSQQSKYCLVCDISPFPPTDIWAMMVVWMVGWTWWDWSLILYPLFSFSALMLLVESLVPYVLTSTSILVTVLIVIKRLLNLALKSAVSAPRHNLQLYLFYFI